MKSKDRIIETAEELFSKHGFDGTSIREIAKQADVNLAMINYYFDSKKGLLEEIIKDRSKRRMQTINEVINTEDSLNKQVYKIVSYITRSLFDNKKLYVLITRELSLEEGISKEVSTLISGDIDKVKGILERSKEHTFNIDPEMLVITMFSTVNTIINVPTLFFRNFGYESVEEMFDPDNYKKVTDQITNHLFQIYLNSIEGGLQ
jgi:AcrR family transcriptional regulator